MFCMRFLVFKGSIVCSMKKGLHSTTLNYNYSLDSFVGIWLVLGIIVVALMRVLIHFFVILGKLCDSS